MEEEPLLEDDEMGSGGSEVPSCDGLTLVPLEEGSMPPRVDRLRYLREHAELLFPGDSDAMVQLRRDVERSYDVPQAGFYHTEGPFMDAHLYLQLRSIDDIAEGRFHPDIPTELRSPLQATVARDKAALQRFAFLHDVHKATCLTICFDRNHVAEGAERKRIVTWDEWLEYARSGGAAGIPDMGAAALAGDEDAMRHFCEANHIIAFSYFQHRKKVFFREHGHVAASYLRHLCPDEEDIVGHSILVEAIQEHMNFHKLFEQATEPNLKSYLKLFAHQTEDQFHFCVTACLMDNLSTLRPGFEQTIGSAFPIYLSMVLYRQLVAVLCHLSQGKVDPDQVVSCLGRKAATSAWRSVCVTVAEAAGLDGDKLIDAVDRLQTESTKFATSDDLRAWLCCNACRDVVNVQRLRQALAPAVERGEYSPEEVEAIVAHAEAQGDLHLKALGPVFRGKARAVLQLLLGCRDIPSST